MINGGKIVDKEWFLRNYSKVERIQWPMGIAGTSVFRTEPVIWFENGHGEIEQGSFRPDGKFMGALLEDGWVPVPINEFWLWLVHPQAIDSIAWCELVCQKGYVAAAAEIASCWRGKTVWS